MGVEMIVDERPTCWFGCGYYTLEEGERVCMDVS